MNKSIQKVVALLTLTVMLMALLPAMSISASAKATNLNEVELDYDALFEDAYIVWPSGSTTAANWTFDFRGKSVSVPYSTTKCFRNFSAAQSAFTRAVGNEGVVTETPVYILIGTVTTNITIYGNAIILGANAGISPNANVDIANKQKTDPLSDLPASTARGTETIIKCSFTHANSKTYDAAAKTKGITEYNVIIDGIKTQDLTTALVINKYTSNAHTVAKNINVSVRNSILDFNKSTIYAFQSSGDSVNNFNVYLKNVRMADKIGSNDYSVHKGLFDNYASKIDIDGLCYTNTNSYKIYNTFTETADQIDIVPENFEFTMKNSVVRCTTASSSNYTDNRLLRFGLAKKKNEITFVNNIFNNCGYKWGIMHIKSHSDRNNSSTVVNFANNTVYVNPSVGEYCTMIEGGDWLAGPFTLNMSYNRVLGFKSMFPNVNYGPFGTSYNLRGTAMYNYCAPTFSSVNDTAGVAPSFCVSTLDFYQFNYNIYTNNKDNLLDTGYYFTDYQMENTSAKFDITETDFYDDLDYISINNQARIIRLRVASGVTVSGLSKNYGFRFKVEPDSVSYSKTSLSSSASTSTMTVTINGSSTTYTIYAEANNSPISYTNLDTNNPSAGFEDNRIYLYSPSGATTATVNGINYSFSGRSYKTIAEIYSTAGTSKTPQIIIPEGEYEPITLTRQVEIYGACFDSPATGGVGADPRYPGEDWLAGKATKIKGITLSSGVASSYSTNKVKISGIVLTGAFTDTARSYAINLNFVNSVVNGGYFNLQNSATTSKTSGTFNLNGVKVVAVGDAGTLFTGNIPYNTTLNNVEIDANDSIYFGGTWASGLASSACTLTVQNSLINKAPSDFFGSITGGKAFSSSSLVIKDCAFTNTATGRHYPSLFNITPANFKSVSITNNWFVNSGSAYVSLFGEMSGSVTFTSNRLIGYEMGNAGSTSKNNNYYAPYSVDFRTRANGRPFGSTYYLDPGLKVTNSNFKVTSVTGGTATISNVLRTIYVNGTGAVSLTLSNGTYKVYSDALLQNETTMSGAGKYFVKATYNNADIVYTVIVTSTAATNFAADGPINSTAFLVTSDVQADNYGEITEVIWKDTPYTFVSGTTAFENVRDALDFAKEKSIASPQVILKNYSGTLSIPGNVKIYTENYDTVPYIDLESEDMDWIVNPAFIEDKTSVTNIQIGPDASGYIEINGVEMTGCYLDVMRTKAYKLNVALNNTLINKMSTDSRVLFDLNGLNTKAHETNSETFTVTNAYVQSATSTRLLYEFYPSNVTFDGLYVNGDTFGIATVNWTKNAGTNSALTFKNCNLRNYAPTNSAFVFQGDNGESDSPVTGETKKLVFDNNIFYNFAFGKSNIVSLQANKYTNIEFTNNKVINSAGNYTLFANTATVANTVPLKFTVTDNLLLGINPQISVGTSIKLDSTSVIARNHTVASCTTKGSGTPITITGATTIKETVYAVDDTMSPLYITDFVINDVISPDDLISSKEVSTSGITVNLTKKVSAADLLWDFGHSDMYPIFYNTSACTTSVNASSVLPGGTYYVKAAYTADDGKVFTGNAYKVKLVFDGLAPDIEALSATLYNDLSLNFKTVGTDELSDVKMVFTIGGTSHEVTESTIDGKYTVFTLDGILPYQMSDFITAKLMSGDQVLDSYTTTFAAYCQVLMLDNPENTKLVDLAVKLLNYGTEAQKYTNYNMSSLANMDLPSTDKVIDTPVLMNIINTEYSKVTNAKASWASHAVILDDALGIKLGFTANAPVSKMSVKVTNMLGQTIYTTNDIWYENGKYYFVFDGLNLCESDEMFFFTIMNGNTAVSNTLLYSVESYAETAQSNASVKTITQALINCSRAAYTYKNSL